ncbi:hypothetical protein RJ640_026405 [Escallonia rubra]|uniref:(+)-neomenthol dehydrogenase-like n=1 Tax=Escallonia rubra TaxID=112253 RepID=A0AA88RCJ8_9ASTE|nr:hypothetical protein RJ640_026405 [Escallonia rubra]
MEYEIEWPIQIKCAVVTGANKGIGLEICHLLASKGILVILTARDEKKGLEATENLKVSGLSNVGFHQLDWRAPRSSFGMPLQCLYSDMHETILDFVDTASATAAGTEEGPPLHGGWGLRGWAKGMEDRAVGAVLGAGRRQPSLEDGDGRAWRRESAVRGVSAWGTVTPSFPAYK